MNSELPETDDRLRGIIPASSRSPTKLNLISNSSIVENSIPIMDLAYIKKKRKEFLIAVYELAEGQAYKAVDVTVLAERLGIDYRNEATKIARYWLDKKILDGGPFDAVFLTTDGVAQAEMVVDETEVQATTKKCPRCWADNRVDAGFCDKCGVKFHNFEAITIDDVTIKNVTIQNVQGLASTLVNTVAPPDSLIGRVLNSKYEIKEKLGQGGFGAVYRARRMKLRDEVAVKVLLHKHLSDPHLRARFEREAIAAANLSHKAVVKIHDFFAGDVAADIPAFIVMELVNGEPLSKLLTREPRLAVNRAMGIIRQVCEGVAVAHAAKIFHRDLKPANIIVLPASSDSNAESVKIIDFGFAKFREEDFSEVLTAVGTVLGTPLYMSPEQCRGERVDASSDVYALGVILYEMLAGALPFSGTVEEIIYKHQHEPPPRLPDRPGLPDKLRDAVNQALAKDPAKRPENAKVLSRQLRNAQS